MSIPVFFTSLFQFIRNITPFLSKKFVYVSMGDSTAEGMGATHADKSFAGIIFQSVKVYKKHSFFQNLGVKELRIADVLRDQLDTAISLKPDLVTLAIGANDLKYTTPLSSFEKDLSVVLERLKKETTALIVVNTIPDVASAPVIPLHLKTITNILVRRYNKVISEQSRLYGVQLVDFYTQSRVFAKTHPEIFAADGYHPSDFGYALWANTIITQIQDTIFKKQKFFSWRK